MTARRGPNLISGGPTMESDTTIDVQAETDPDDSMADDDLLAAQPKGLEIKDGSSNT